MSAKYSIFYRDSFDQQCRVNITPAIGWSADPIQLRAVASSAFTLSWEASDDPYEDPIVNSKADISVYQDEAGSINILEIQEAGDRDFIVDFYIENILKWKGFLVPDGVKQIFQSAPFELSLTATDGLKLMDSVNYSHDNLQGGRCIINYFRRILFAPANLGLELPLRWVADLRNEAFPLELDALSGSVRWAPRGEGFVDDNGNYKSCLYILTEMARSLQCRLFQSEGIWNLERINDVVSGTFIYRQISGLSGFNISVSQPTSFLKKIASKTKNPDYAFINEDAYNIIQPALKKVKTTYEQDQRSNVLPNGNMDIVVSTANAPLYWGGTDLTIESIPSLSEAKGNAVSVTNFSNGDNFRVTRLPQSAQVSQNPLRYRLLFFFTGIVKTGDRIYMSDVDVDTGQTINQYEYTVPPQFNNNTAGALNDFAQSPAFFTSPNVTFANNEWTFAFTANVRRVAGTSSVLSGNNKEFTHEGYLPIDTDILYETINLGFKFSIINGYITTGDTQIIDWSKTQNNIRIEYDRGNGDIWYLNEFGFWVNVYTEILITVNQYKAADIAQIDFNSHQNIKMPLPNVTPIDRTNPPSIKFVFLLPPGRKILLDDVYFTVEDNSDVIEAVNSGTTNTKAQEYTLKISSAHSGFYVSNYMTNYTQSGVEKFFSDSKFGGTLTAINSNAILRNRYRPSMLFQSSVYSKAFYFGEIYNIDTLENKNFLPLKTSWNTETNIIDLSCLEIRDDSINADMIYYGKNDKTITSN